ncbi:hypothetical protein CORT_0B11240 [Candida orthopsilosis Co 90-125]|uniref:Uncharacterized protein n=1 Tax=Candida orthopsilosis (strain 90-125) TaxID=1136231 RepID=H8X2A1_CANO9|nr:hypothetical protein CORT_0B11240 [Candida orthopsilosis Co 90-125]CCG22823.1 hypothetical protein CORT_0B11240 [Candida orthopsilosis Co 90-125]
MWFVLVSIFVTRFCYHNKKITQDNHNRRVTMTQVQLSPCKNYIGQIQPLEDSIALNIFQNPHNTLYRSFQVIEIIQSKFVPNNIPSSLDISFQWEYNYKGKDCEKLAVLVRNMAALFFLDINKYEASSVLIRQPQYEGIESFQWLPPTDHEKKTGYANSSQIVLFSELNLSANIYSLDCTRRLFTIDKPINDRIIYRRTSSGSFWCMLADTFEYNVPPTMYQFSNLRSFSLLMNSARLHNFVSEEVRVDWSPSGNWLQILDQNEALSGHNLKVYGSNGTSGPNFAKPLVDIEFESEVEEDGLVRIARGGIHNCWCSIDSEEFILLARLVGDQLELKGVSMKLLKVVLRATKDLKEIVAQSNVRDDSIDVMRVLQLHELIFVQLGKFMLCLFHRTGDAELNFLTAVETQSDIVDIIANKSRWFIITKQQILLYEKSLVKALLSTNIPIYSASLLDKDTIVVFSRGPDGEFWNYLNIEESSQNSKARGTSSNHSTDEITDTFAIRKRARIQ